MTTHEPADDLARVSRNIVACQRCPRLVEWRERVAREKRTAFRDEEYWGRPVPGWGDPDARLLVLGLAPAAHGGNRTGRVFTGDRSGDWLYRALFEAGFANQPQSTARNDGLTLKGAYIAAAVRCAPPGNRPTTEERIACEPFLRREWTILERVRVVVALGRFAFDAVRRLDAIVGSASFSHGAELRLASRRTLLCSYHPSQQNTFTGRLTKEMLSAVFERARELVDEERE